MSSRQWRSLMEGLGSSYRVLAPDFLGSGKNPPWPETAPFHFDLDVREVAHLVHDIGEPTHVIGHSYGGLIALTLARLHPALVRSLTLYDPVAFGVLYDPPDAEGLADLAAASEKMIFSNEDQGGREPWLEAFVDYWNGAGTWRALPETTRRGFIAVGRKVFREVGSLMADRTRAAAYRHLLAPTLILSGERTPASAKRVAAVLASALPSARVESIVGAGHMGPITHATAVNDAIAKHLAST